MNGHDTIGMDYKSAEISPVHGTSTPDYGRVPTACESILESNELERLQQTAALISSSIASTRGENFGALGKRLLNAGLFASGMRAYQLAGISPSPADLVRCGASCLGEGLVEQAFEAYALAHLAPPAEKLHSCQIYCLQHGRIDDALLAERALAASRNA